MDASIDQIISVCALALIMFSPVLAILLVPTADKDHRAKRLEAATRE